MVAADRLRVGCWLGASLLMLSTTGCGAGPGRSSAESTSPQTGPSRGASSAPAQRPSSPPATRSASVTPEPEPACADLLGSMSLREQIGQLFMVGVPSSGLSMATERALEDARAGSVVLLGTTTAGVDAVHRVTEQARAAARRPEGVELLIAADQEGGQVQRLRGEGFSDIPSAAEQAELSDARLRRRAARWGKELAEAGVDANLAPVADVVPADLENVNQPIGVLGRGYGPEVDVVADKVTAFVHGMHQAGIATTVKHFPGLGRVRSNTDYTADVIDDSTRRGDEDLGGFTAGVSAGVDMVMMSSATYRRIDRDHRAAHSTEIIDEMVRRDLGFPGVVISDDLATVAMADLSPRARILRFWRAGGDLAIVGDPTMAVAMADAVAAEARDDAGLAKEVEGRARRVLALKSRYGLADC